VIGKKSPFYLPLPILGHTTGRKTKKGKKIQRGCSVPKTRGGNNIKVKKRGFMGEEPDLPRKRERFPSGQVGNLVNEIGTVRPRT